jgi:HSP20 family protein
MAMDEKKEEKKEDPRPEKKHRKGKNADLGIQIWIPKEMLSDLDSVFDFMRHRMEDRPRISHMMHAAKAADAASQSPSAQGDAAHGPAPSPDAEECTGKVKVPKADIVDDGKAYIIKAEIPGVPKEKVDINVTQFQLEIKADIERDVEEKGKGFIRRERRHSSYFRSIPFPTAVVPDKVEARMEHGILRITVPKEDPGRSSKKKVEIK